MSTTKEKIRIMQAFEDGKPIEQLFENGIPPLCFDKGTYSGEPDWNWLNCEYRIKREPRRVWIVYNEEGNIHDVRFEAPLVRHGYTWASFLEELK
jgi:hypothetical protein